MIGQTGAQRIAVLMMASSRISPSRGGWSVTYLAQFVFSFPDSDWKRELA